MHVPVCPWVCMWVAVVFMSGRLPCRSTELHIKQAVLKGPSLSLDTDPVSLGGGRVISWLRSCLLEDFLSLPSFSCFPSSLTSYSSAFRFSTHTHPVPLTWRGKQAKWAVAAQRDQNQASKSCFTSLVDSIAMITAKISHFQQSLNNIVWFKRGGFMAEAF